MSLEGLLGEGVELQETDNQVKELVPFKITFKSLKISCQIAFKNLKEGRWEPKHVKAFLDPQVVNKELREEIVQYGMLQRSMRAVEEAYTNRQHDASEEETNKLRDALDNMSLIAAKCPQLFKHWKPPPMWSNVYELERFIEVLMHLLFLGNVKSLVQQSLTFLAGKRLKKDFLAYAEPLLDQVKKLDVSWCKCRDYRGDKLAGWVSENYMAFARVVGWFYSGVEGLTEEPILHEDPTGLPQSTWVKLQNQLWLRARNLDDSGTAKEVKERVAGLMDRTEGPPPVVGPIAGTIRELLCTWRVLNRIIALVMQRECTEHHPPEVERLVKIFLYHQT